MKATGRVFKYGDNVDTDVIIPARYLNSSDPARISSIPVVILIRIIIPMHTVCS